MNQDVFDMSVLINNSKDNEITEMMTNVIDVLKDQEFVRYFTVDVGNALDIFEEEISDLNTNNKSLVDDADSDDNFKK